MQRVICTLVCLGVLGCGGSSDGIGAFADMSGPDSPLLDMHTPETDMHAPNDAGNTDAAAPVMQDAAVVDASMPNAGNFGIEEISPDDDFAPFFNKRVVVFGIQIVGTARLPRAKLLHAAHVMAEYLDNDEDGQADDPAVVTAMVNARSVLVMAQTPDELESSGLFESPILSRYAGQDLYGEETNEPGRFDAALEEVLHLISNYGYASVYPDAFGTDPGTLLSNAMDLARGGQFLRVPNEYPSDAWYTYDDRTCEYECMATEYLYWGMTTILGAQESQERCEEIRREWRLCTREQVRLRDQALYALLTDPQYKLPTRLPTGEYAPSESVSSE